ncbi:hypothetical protein [Halapricum desulfuricans]|uniref:hypothetical protein n=1 Tax=Halapricum desulfuricans TaxID=2841257 RepID=UPI001E646500|nr:hypothetical protein [Halapricum desulfuricans]
MSSVTCGSISVDVWEQVAVAIATHHAQDLARRGSGAVACQSRAFFLGSSHGLGGLEVVTGTVSSVLR